jgi:hypothetical protein
VDRPTGFRRRGGCGGDTDRGVRAAPPRGGSRRRDRRGGRLRAVRTLRTIGQIRRPWVVETDDSQRHRRSAPGASGCLERVRLVTRRLGSQRRTGSRRAPSRPPLLSGPRALAGSAWTPRPQTGHRRPRACRNAVGRACNRVGFGDDVTAVGAGLAPSWGRRPSTRTVARRCPGCTAPTSPARARRGGPVGSLRPAHSDRAGGPRRRGVRSGG